MRRATSQTTTRREAEERLLRRINSMAEELFKEGANKEEIRKNLQVAFRDQEKKPPWLDALIEAIIVIVVIIVEEFADSK